MRFLFLVAVAGAYGQTLALSPARHVGDLQQVSFYVCPVPGSIIVNAGRIYGAAVQARFVPILPAGAGPVVNSNVASNWRNVLLEVLDAASLGAAVAIATQTGTTAAESNRWLKWIQRILSFHSVTEFFKEKLRAHAPDPASLIAGLLDPDARIDLSAGCKSGMILSHYGKGIQNAAVKVDIGTP